MEIELFSSKVPAGFPSPATDHLEKRIDLNDEYIQHPLSTFIIQSEGYSMKDAFIPDKARLIIDKSLTPKNGDIILAVLNGEFTVKYLKINDVKCSLVPANNKFLPIEITSETDFSVWGVVTSIIINPKDVRCML